MEQKDSINQMFTHEIVAMLGRRFKDYRIGSDLTQKDVSEKSGVSIITIRKFENGQLFNITFGTVIELLRAIGFMEGINDLLPEIPVSPYELDKLRQGKRKRLRHGK